MKFQWILFFVLLAKFSSGQAIDYDVSIKKGDSLFASKKYVESAQQYINAFRTNRWKGRIDHRLRAAEAWSLAGVRDSAFLQLNKVAESGHYSDYEELVSNPNFKTLKGDKRWQTLIEKVKSFRDAEDAKLNKPLIEELKIIFKDDQSPRLTLDSLVNKHGPKSEIVEDQLRLIRQKDSINLLKVQQILDRHGWLGAETIGKEGNLTLFLVIQHADLNTQLKYLPMVRDAVKNNRAVPANLALLEDRIAIRQGKKQIYGTQIGRNIKTGESYVLPLDDPDNVNKRRRAVRLEPLEEYLSQWKIEWDAEQHKKDVMGLEDEKIN